MNKKDNLLKKICVSCEGKGIKPFDRAEAEDYLAQIPSWAMDKEVKKIFKEFKFQDFIGAMNFVQYVADIAEQEGHHPDIEIHYNKVKLILWTHAIGGLSVNDFIVAAKVDSYK